jgi:hypothetical protein
MFKQNPMKKKKIQFLVMTAIFVVTLGQAQTIPRQVLSEGGTTSGSGGYSLCWTLGQPGPVSLATSASLIVTQGFQQGDEVEVGVINYPSVDELIRVFPNPSDGVFSLEGIFSGPVTLACDIYDCYGRKIQKKTIEVPADGHFQYPLDLKGSSPGVYLLQVSGKSTRVTENQVIRLVLCY